MARTVNSKRQLQLTSLEDRTVMAASVSASLRSGVLTITGTETADTIVVRQADKSISVEANGQRLSFAAASQIVIDGRGGDDKLYVVSSGSGRPTPSVIHGGAGNDLIVGGGGADKLYGDGGNDTVYGGDGDDWIEGGLGADRIYGNAGNDTVFGGAGQDFISGGQGKDYLSGGEGADSIYGNEGADTILGGAGDDLIDGGEGDDVAYGETGNDWLYGSGSNDKLYGGEGDDRLNGGPGSDTFDGGSGFDTYQNEFDDVLDTRSEVQDVKQGDSGTCVLLSSLAAVTLSGIDLASRIEQTGTNQFSVPLYREGKGWIRQTVYFDGNWTDNDPKLANPGDAWVLIYQRAYLQEMGVRWTDPDQSAWADKYGDKFQRADSALRAITGSATWRGNLEAADLADLKSALKEKRPAITLTEANNAEKYGFISGHAYTIISVSSDNKVTVRNPWGTDGPRRQGADDGLITISWETFRSVMQGFVTV